MPPRYSFESEQLPYQQQPLHAPPPEAPPRYQSPPPNLPHQNSAQPDSSFDQLRSQRAYSNRREPAQPAQSYAPAISSAPPPPPHRNSDARTWGRESGYTSGISNITPGADNFGEQAQGGMAGLALGVADANARESGVEAMRNTPGYSPRGVMEYEDSPYARPPHRQEISQSSLTPLGAAAFPPGHGSPSLNSSVSQLSRSNGSFHDQYSDNIYYNRHSQNLNPNMEFDPNSIEDDGDDGLEYRNASQRGSKLNLNQQGDRGAAPVAGAAAAGGIMGTLGGLVGRNTSGSNPQYDPVGNAHTAYNGPNDYDLGQQGQEKSAWLRQQKTGKKRYRGLILVVCAIVLIGAIAGGVAGGILSSRSSSEKSTSTGQSASGDTASNGDLNKDSTDIKKLMNNSALHKVFPGIDYTPMNTQYPDCLTNPPSQNNVTRDLAVLSQLTNIVRLYGTDCNQTEMLLHSIDQLGLNGTIKVWLGVWQDTNTTTNARQLAQMYDIFDKYGAASFLGVIVGNEVLYRKDMTTTELGNVITGVRNNLTSRGFKDLAIASSDLGDNWSSAPELVTLVDYVMANIHPFFAGVPASQGSSWTNTFFKTHDVPLKSDASKSIISETGWPSGGGTDCGTTTVTSCPNGAVAGVTEMNTFMDDFVCSSLNNGTNYFWFEAFDEPWKIMYNTDNENWEDKWGLMDVNRNLKTGVVIPDCGGKTVGTASL